MLIERDSAANALHKGLLDVVNGRGSSIVVKGDPGSGKTSLLSDLVGKAGQVGAHVLVARAARTETDLPYGVLSHLFNGPIVRSAPWGTISELIDQLMVTVGEAQRRTMHRICNEILHLATTTPVLICVDDVHHADAASVDLLRCLSRCLDLSPLLIVLTELGHPSEMGSPQSTLRSPFPECEHIRLPPLSTAGITALLTDYLGAEAASKLSDEVAQVTACNPALANAIGRDIAQSRSMGSEALEVTAGQHFCDAYRNSLSSSGPVALHVVNILALISPNGDTTIVTRLIQVSEATFNAEIKTLTGAGLLDGLRFRHREARHAVLANLSQQEQGELQKRIAKALFSAGAHKRVILQHLVHAECITDSWASGFIADTAEQVSLEDAESESAVHRLLITSGHKMAKSDRARASAAIANVEWQVNPRAAVRRLLNLSEAVLGGHLRDYRALDVYKALLWAGETTNAATVLMTLRATLDLNNFRNRSALMSAREMTEVLFPVLFQRLQEYLPDISTTTDHATVTDPRRTALLTPEPVVAATPNSDLTRLRRSVSAGSAAIDAFALPIGLLMINNEPLNNLGLNLEPGSVHENSPMHGLTAFLNSEISIRNMDFPAALTHGRSALECLPSEAWGVGIAAPLSNMLVAATQLNKMSEAQTLVNARVPPAVFESIFGLRLLLSRGQFFLARGSYNTALEEFVTCGQAIQDWGVQNNTPLGWRQGAAEAWLGLGDKGQARKLLEEELSLCGSHPSQTRVAILRLLSTAARPRQRANLLRESDDMLRELQNCSEVPRMNDKFDSARAFIQRSGCERVRDVTPLSQAERRVGQLASHGLRNQDIARRLSVTVSTVEQHLTSVYRKLEVKGRAQLHHQWFSDQDSNTADHLPYSSARSAFSTAGP